MMTTATKPNQATLRLTARDIVLMFITGEKNIFIEHGLPMDARITGVHHEDGTDVFEFFVESRLLNEESQYGILPCIAPKIWENDQQPAVAGEITKRQRAIFLYIYQYTKSHGYPPTIRQIGKHFNISSTNGVSHHIKQLVEKGYLKKANGVSRGLALKPGGNGAA